MKLKHIVIGILAHVDAGKTTLSEAMMYTSGAIRSFGRVDHKDAYLDYDLQERQRGITIYSKEAELTWQDLTMSFVDTPGHIDFTSEMERTLPILDYAIVIISALDGVQAHTKTIWNMLKAYHIPVFIFVNKMDITYHTKAELMKNIQEQLHVHCLDFQQDFSTLQEEVSMCDDALLETYFNQGELNAEEFSSAIAQRKVFPCFFGSALKLDGIKQLLDGLLTYVRQPLYPSEFGAKVYKISHDEQNNRLTHVKVTGGTLKAKMKLSESEKVDQLRSYTGSKYEVIQEAKAGDLCVIKGLKEIQVKDGLGFEEVDHHVESQAVMNYHMVLPKGTDAFVMMKELKPFMDEDPTLHIVYREDQKEIRVQIMGEVQMEILKEAIHTRLGIDVSFDQGMVNYKETILHPVEGVGHYEPLRHYSEVHILLEPLPANSGIVIASDVGNDRLDRHWQRLIETHMGEKEHLGVLGGYPLTDVKMTLVSGKAHLKHTDGGDFRQATYRAIRQGLMKCESILLEPYYSFRLEVPTAQISKAIFDLETMNASFEIEQQEQDYAIVKGEASVDLMRSYPLQVRSYTKGKGKLTCCVDGYRPVKNQEELLMKINYDPLRDVKNPSSSVFCIHGSSVIVPWDEVENYMHLPSYFQQRATQTMQHRQTKVDDAELKRVFESIYGKPKEKRKVAKKVPRTPSVVHQSEVKILPECLLVDGYNMIYDWSQLKELAKDHIDAARDRLIDALNNYQGYRKCEVIVVFDAYKRKQQAATISKQGNVHVVFTKTSQTADSYIEMTTHKLAKDYRIRVATSDGLEQLIVIGQGASRISAREFEQEVMQNHTMSIREYHKSQPVFRHQALEKIREFQDDEDGK